MKATVDIGGQRQTVDVLKMNAKTAWVAVSAGTVTRVGERRTWVNYLNLNGEPTKRGYCDKRTLPFPAEVGPKIIKRHIIKHNLEIL